MVRGSVEETLNELLEQIKWVAVFRTDQTNHSCLFVDDMMDCPLCMGQSLSLNNQYVTLLCPSRDYSRSARMSSKFCCAAFAASAGSTPLISTCCTISLRILYWRT